MKINQFFVLLAVGVVLMATLTFHAMAQGPTSAAADGSTPAAAQQQPESESSSANATAESTELDEGEYVKPYETPQRVQDRIDRIETAKEKTPALFAAVAPQLVPDDSDPLWDYVPDSARRLKPDLMRTPATELLHPIYQDAVRNYPKVFDAFKQAAQECRDRVAAIDPPDRTLLGPIHKEYLDKLEQLKAKHNLTNSEKRLLRDASWFRNGTIPSFNPAYVLAWEDALLSDDVSQYMKLWVVKILWNIDNPKSSLILGEALRDLAMTPTPYEKERRAANMLTDEILEGMFERPRPDILMELGETTMLPGMGDRKYTVKLRIGKLLSESAEWLDLMNEHAANPEYQPYVASLHEAVDLYLNTIDGSFRARFDR